MTPPTLPGESGGTSGRPPTVTGEACEFFRRETRGGGKRSLPASTTLDALTIEIQRSLDFYERHFAQPSIGGIVLTGLEQPVAGLAEYLQAQLGIPTRWLDLAALCPTDAVVPPATLARGVLASGAALRGGARAA